jgi:hypothetical protein
MRNTTDMPRLEYQRRDTADWSIPRWLEWTLAVVAVVSGLSKFVLTLSGLYTIVSLVAYFQRVRFAAVELAIVPIATVFVSAMFWGLSEWLYRTLIAPYR